VSGVRAEVVLNAVRIPISRLPSFRRDQQEPDPFRAAVRVATRSAPQTLTLVRHRTQPTAVTIVRLTVTATFAYLIAQELIPGTPAVLAPLTALLVAQVSLYQTLRAALTKVAAVVIGVLLAIGLSAAIGFTWWSLTITIGVALVIGYSLRLGENVLEVPISAMLILSVGSTSAADQRIFGTIIGTGAGLISGFVFVHPQVQSAQDAIHDYCDRMADLLGRMAGGLRDGSVRDEAANWFEQARNLASEIRRVDEALRKSEESVRLNPRSASLPLITASLRESIETVEHEAITLRMLARAVTDSSGLGDQDSPMNDPEVRARLAAALEELSAALRTYGAFAAQHETGERPHLESELDQHLSAAEDRQNELSELLNSDPRAKPGGWPLRGEVISNLDRLRTDLGRGKPSHSTYPRQRSLIRPARAPLKRRRPRPRLTRRGMPRAARSRSVEAGWRADESRPCRRLRIGMNYLNGRVGDSMAVGAFVTR
jgi:uncharacterized membrane protein YgaE (UPF0421/DUF939 family)